MATKKSKVRKTGKAPTTATGGLAFSADLAETNDIGNTPDIGDTPDIGNTPDLSNTSDLPHALKVHFTGATGDDILQLARKHIGETYVLGARAPMANKDWRGPWDCAEFVSWCVFQSSGVLYGTKPRDDPMMADAFTGFWAEQAQAGGHMIGLQAAASIAGAAVLRKPTSGLIGHIVISDGKGGTVEAHSSLRGVIASTLSGRRWDAGILVPGIRYLRADTPVVLESAPHTIRLTQPLTRGDAVRAIQQRLQALGLPVGKADGVYGPQTAHTVRTFQASNGLVADGEVGPATRTALGIH